MDKFYTKIFMVEKCLRTFEMFYRWTDFDLIIEPSAGNGNFLLKIPGDKKIGIDIEPEHKDIIKQDFLTYVLPTTYLDKNILIIGNPPFGRVSSLAVKFFNHAANFANVIAFIVPRTFRRISVQNKLNLYFHLINDEDVPLSPCAFNPPMNAKCCFQIWERKDTERNIEILINSHDDWDFIDLGPKDENGQPTPPNNADFVIRAYGSNCGEIITTNLNTLRPKSYHWIKSNIDKQILIERFQSLDYSISTNTARQNSIGRGELVKLYINKFN